MSAVKYKGKAAKDSYPHSDIVTLTDGKATIADIHIRIGDTIYWGSGSARRMKGDVNDPSVGDLLSTYRALSKIVAEMQKDVRKHIGGVS